MKNLDLSIFQEVDSKKISKSETFNNTHKKSDLPDFVEVNIPGTKSVKSNVERPASKGLETHRGFCVNLPYNKDLIDQLQVVIQNIKADCKEESFFDGDFDVIDNISDLKRLLTEVIIRFDTAPDYYTKSDYAALIAVLYQSLLYLYQRLNLNSSNEDILRIEQTEEGTELQPQVGYLYDHEEGEKPKDSEGNVVTTPENNDKRVATVGDIRNYINNKLTWIEQ